MKWLFFYAHPDDESVAAAGTIRQLVDLGDEVILAYATGGENGSIKNDKVLGMSRKEFNSLSGPKKREIVINTRKEELEKARKILGVSEVIDLEFGDGDTNNNVVWGEMADYFAGEIEKHKPNFLVTFDHTGWYFHMDHVGVSLATMNAMNKSNHKVDLLLFNIFNPPGMKSKWKYHYPKNHPITHKVDVSKVRNIKKKALKAHRSQDLSIIKSLEEGKLDEEYFQVVKSTSKGKKFLDSRKMFVQAKQLGK